MGDMRTEMQKLNGVSASKPKRKTPVFKRAKPVAVRTLISEYGNDRTADMLGVSSSGLSTMISKDDVSETIELLAEMLLLNEGKTVVIPKSRLIIARVPAEHADIVGKFLAALKIKSYDFSE